MRQIALNEELRQYTARIPLTELSDGFPAFNGLAVGIFRDMLTNATLQDCVLDKLYVQWNDNDVSINGVFKVVEK